MPSDSDTESVTPGMSAVARCEKPLAGATLGGTQLDSEAPPEPRCVNTSGGASNPRIASEAGMDSSFAPPEGSSPSARPLTTRGTDIPRSHEVAHILVITGDPTQPSQKWAYAVECPGVTDQCRVWNECLRCRRQPAGSHLAERREIHGTEHVWTSFGWAYPSDDCLGALEDMPWEVGTDLVSNECLPGPGRYPVRWAQAGGSAVGDLELVREAVARG